MGDMDRLFDGSDAHLLTDSDELRDIAEWMDSLGKSGNADFLRRIADKLAGSHSELPNNSAELRDLARDMMPYVKHDTDAPCPACLIEERYKRLIANTPAQQAQEE